MIKVVIADDEKAVSKIIQHFIEREKLPLQVEGIALDGESALQMIRKKEPDLVFLDIKMPLMDGFEVMEALEALRMDVKIVVITAYESFEYAQRALRMGARDIILKPIEYEQFTQALLRSVGWNFTGNDLVNQVLEYIHTHFSDKIELQLLSEQFHVTASYLSKQFKRYVDTNLISYVNKIRIEHAVEMLKNGSYNIQEVAKQAGYENVNYFYKKFKEQTGHMPSDYLKK